MSGTGTPGAQQTQTAGEYEIGGKITPALLARLAVAEAERDAAFKTGETAHRAGRTMQERAIAAEQERDKALGQLHYVPDDWRYTGRLRAAEARVEALERALETLATAEDFVDEEDYQAFARAALACPPQQTEGRP